MIVLNRCVHSLLFSPTVLSKAFSIVVSCFAILALTLVVCFRLVAMRWKLHLSSVLTHSFLRASSGPGVTQGTKVLSDGGYTLSLKQVV